MKAELRLELIPQNPNLSKTVTTWAVQITVSIMHTTVAAQDIAPTNLPALGLTLRVSNDCVRHRQCWDWYREFNGPPEDKLEIRGNSRRQGSLILKDFASYTSSRVFSLTQSSTNHSKILCKTRIVNCRSESNVSSSKTHLKMYISADLRQILE